MTTTEGDVPIVESLAGLSFTLEQKKILETCKAPTVAGRSDEETTSKRPKHDSVGSLTRVTAAAGAGKTTTLLGLALQGAAMGHSHITYVTFTRAAANDGHERLVQALGREGIAAVQLDAKTLHACAQKSVREHLKVTGSVKDEYADENTTLLSSDHAVRKWIAEQCRSEIEIFLKPLASSRLQSGTRSRQDYKRVFDKVVGFIEMTLIRNFCCSALSKAEFNDRQTWQRVYFPSKLAHQRFTRYYIEGFEKLRDIHFYADQACRLWDMIEQRNNRIHTHDFFMKRAQLLALGIPGTLILLDESQDMDACQVQWAATQQVKYGKRVYVVGDAAQTIYGFRGAKSSNLMSIPADTSRLLTTTWRFGPKIAAVANVVLFAKHNSPQTSVDRYGSYNNWDPYRVQVGLADKPGRVTMENLLPKWRTLAQESPSNKLTLIAWKNSTLLMKALELLKFKVVENEDKKKSCPVTDTNQTYIPRVSLSPQKSPLNEETFGEADVKPDNFPRIHLNGRGESSGLAKWKSALKEVEQLFQLYMGSKEDAAFAMELPESTFPEFKGQKLTFETFRQDVVQGERSKYLNSLNVIEVYKDRTMDALEVFEKHVVDRSYTAAEAHVILTTCHSAKGMEFDTVQICNDFIEVCTYIRTPQDPTKPGTWSFGFKCYGDDVNLLYVACTRAKRCLSLEKSTIPKVLEDFDAVHRWKISQVTENPINFNEVELFARIRVPDSSQANEFYESLVRPLRQEFGLDDDDEQRLMNFVFSDS